MALFPGGAKFCLKFCLKGYYLIKLKSYTLFLLTFVTCINSYFYQQGFKECTNNVLKNAKR